MEKFNNLIYFYDGSFEGLFTAVFDIYKYKEIPENIITEENYQYCFGNKEIRVKTNIEKYKRVESGIINKLGTDFLNQIVTTFLSDYENKEISIFNYIYHGMKFGKKAFYDLANDSVNLINNICKNVYGEVHQFKGFVRFSRLDNDLYYAKISPKHNIIPLIMQHFVDRYSVQLFVIHDNVHQIAGVYDGDKWYMVNINELNLPGLHDEELLYRGLWTSFYDSIAIKERKNLKCQMSHMPKRFWRNLTEKNTFYK